MVSLMPEEAFATLRREIGAFDRLDERERLALATALIEGDVTNTRMQDLVSDHPSDITKLLRGLVAKKLLDTDNQRRWTRYRLPSSIAPRHDLFSLREAGDSSHTRPDSTRNAIESSHTGADSPPTEADLEGLRAIAEPVAAYKRASPAKLQAVILHLCRGRFLTAEQIANLCNRDVAGLRSRTLSKTVKVGTLRLRYPNTPNRPDQAYTAADEAP
jgi:ATP-dependent DNA helicase RecG